VPGRADDRLPAALGQLLKPGPVNTPPPGAASPIAATGAFEAAAEGRGSARTTAPSRTGV